MDRPLVTVVVPTRNRPRMLDRCLGCVTRALGPGDELIVVDSASDTDEVRAVALQHGATYLRCDEKGAARARNRGWRAARHSVVAFTDDDVRVAEDWLESACRAFIQHPESSFLIGRVDVPAEDGEVIRPVAIMDEPKATPISGDYRGKLGASANLTLRWETLERVGGFDERLGPGADLGVSEDHDLLDRILAVGLSGRYEPTVRAWHEQWRDPRTLIRLDWDYGNGMGARVAKLVRSDPKRAAYVAGVIFWEWGLRDVMRYGRERHRFLVVTSLVRVLGGLRGLARGLFVPVRNGHFRGRRPRSGLSGARFRPG